MKNAIVLPIIIGLWFTSDYSNTMAFNKTTHFNTFFKKNVELSPLKFRNI